MISRLPSGIRPGKHQLTLQWIGWDRPGTVMISSLGDGKYSITGQQLSADQKYYLRIKGELRELSQRELVFTGTIDTRAEGVNNEQECKRSGTYHFSAKGKRRYWRLQEMTNCEGNMVTDYIDIYF